jgi:putative transposase
MTRAAERWRSIRFTEFERRQIDAVRQELDGEYEATNVAKPASQQARPDTGISSSSRT